MQLDDFRMMVVLAQELNMRKSGGTIVCVAACAESTASVDGKAMGGMKFFSSLTKRA
ncbi:hypothetical protein GCM10020331_044370 [Ectobacillus funiculus]